MPERPLLLFPQPGNADRTKLPRSRNNLHKPTHTKQGKRLQKLFDDLENQIKLHLSISPSNTDHVLVLETIGSVENFANAVKNINGLEWIAEIDIEEIEPDENFHDKDNEKKMLSGRLYLIMSDQDSLKQIRRLWKKYADDKNFSFDLGFAKFKYIFDHLKDIRLWDIRDRVKETGVLEDWKKELEDSGKEKIRFQIELWFRNKKKREDAYKHSKSLIEEVGGKLLEHCTIEDIAYHAILAEISADKAQEFIDRPDAVGLFICGQIMFVLPVGQAKIEKQVGKGYSPEYDQIKDTEAPAGDPIVAILDGLPLENHKLLESRLIIEDPDNYASHYHAKDRRHGTAMASLIVHGDLNENASPLSHPVYVRPIMKPVPVPSSDGLNNMEEEIPDDILLVDYVHRAVRRIFEGEGQENASAPTVKIINFSIGDANRQFSQILSPLARLLDWLSIKYQVLFVISAGNHKKINIIKDSFSSLNDLSDKEKESKIVATLYKETQHRKLLSPAESINGVTVGALHHDAAEMPSHASAENLFVNELPSPISAFGYGYRRAVKPDLVSSGGRVLSGLEVPTDTGLSFILKNRPRLLGHKVAAPGPEGELSTPAYSYGTSNAAALTSRVAALCHDTLLEIFEEQASEEASYVELQEPCLTSLIKAMVIHSCSWGKVGENLKSIIKESLDGQKEKERVTQWLGYGVPEYGRVLECTGQRVTLLGYGHLLDGEAHIFDLPLPPSMKSVERRLTVTLAWISPVASNTQRYRSAQLWFEVDKPNGDKEEEYSNAFEKGPIQVGNYASKRGTVQHAIFESKTEVKVEDGNLSIKVNCRKDAAEILTPVPYGLAVTFELTEKLDIKDMFDINIYDEIRKEIRSRITPQVEIEPIESI